MIGKWRLMVADPNRVYICGLDMGGMGKMITRNDEYVVVKWPSSKCWAGIGMVPTYHSPKTTVFRILEEYTERTKYTGNVLVVEWVIEWDNTRKERS